MRCTADGAHHCSADKQVKYWYFLMVLVSHKIYFNEIVPFGRGKLTITND